MFNVNKDLRICESLPEGSYVCFMRKTYTYALYEDGRVWSFYRNRFIKPSVDKDGYLIIHLVDKTVKLHRLVCRVYNGECPGSYLQVRHLDGEPKNNHYSNLKWGTGTENWKDRKDHGRSNSGKKCTPELALLIRKLYMRIISEVRDYVLHISDITGVSRQTVSHIVKLQTWNYPQCIPEGYKYESKNTNI